MPFNAFQCQWMLWWAGLLLQSKHFRRIRDEIVRFLSKCQTNWMPTKTAHNRLSVCMRKRYFLNANKIDDPLTKYFVFDCLHTHCVHGGAQKYTGLSQTNTFVCNTHTHSHSQKGQKCQAENKRRTSFVGNLSLFACQKICVTCQK